MLEKMGWQHGKGLGAKEDGITEHVRVSYKNDSKGMGYKESNDQWTEHESNFSALLESLTGTIAKSDEIKLQSLEKKSETSRARLHYRKFTRGKDLSRYSEKDLANIFGKKSLKEPKKEVKEEPSNSNIEKLEKDSTFLVNAGSMKDYFKKKLPNFGKTNGFVVGTNGVLQKGESDSETEARPSFSFSEVQNSDSDSLNGYAGFGFKSEVKDDTSTSISNVKEDNIESDKKKKKKKRKVEEIEVPTPKKKSKREDTPKKLKTGDVGMSNPAFNPLYTPVKVEKHVLDTIDETFSEDMSLTEENVEIVETEVEVHETKKYMKKSKKNEDVCNAVSLDERSGKGIEIDDVGAVKKKKKNKSSSGIDNSNFVEISSDISQCVETPVKVQTEETRKKKKKEKLLVENSAFLEIEGNNHEVQTLEKPKKKKDKLAVENPCFIELEQDSIGVSQSDNNLYEVKPKKKKKKEEQRVEKSSSIEDFENAEVIHKKQKKRKEAMAVENPGFNESMEYSEVTQVEENPYEVKQKKRKNLELEKPTSDASADNLMSEENFYEIKRKKKKKKNEGKAIENPAFCDATDSSVDLSQTEENLTNVDCELKKNGYEVERKKKVKKRKENEDKAIENPAFCDATDSLADLENSMKVDSELAKNAFEVERKKKAKKRKEENGIVNPCLDLDTSLTLQENKEIEGNSMKLDSELNKNTLEVERRKKSKKKKEDSGITNPGLDLDTSSSTIQENVSLNIEESDLMLNVVTTPILSKPRTENSDTTFSITKINSIKRRKSVRFSDITQERIIPNNDDLKNMSDAENRNELFDINTQVLNSSLEDQNHGLDNLAFDRQRNRLEENLESMSKTLDRYQAEIENDINEKKIKTFAMDDIMVGEVGNPHGENERLAEGTRLKFKYANFMASKVPFYHLDQVGPKKGYRHLIKGDIVVKFNNTNLHRIEGYGVKNVKNRGAIA